ncbi:5-oxoprolinase isoform X1 [Corvus hawaiiensis]|nr:5-oxoprolinase isoform X1 [Corvus hawaiiensis]XP_048142290.1 5-oxoprolinase isoform X2 [Corvus hawaiiensis]XP_048142292.1 5-oxoprolinase isoform X1 [Corvus hawaiiensis]
MAGGLPGAPGLNLLLRRDGRLINLGGKSSVSVEPGDVFRLLTPGGGGFGPPEDGTGGDPRDPPDPQDLWAPQSSPKPPNPASAPSAPAPQTFLERGSVFEFRQAQEAV